MSDFSLGVEVNVLAKKAMREVDKLRRSFLKMGRDLKNEEKEDTMAIKRLSLALAALGAVAGGALGQIISWSPSVAAAFSLIKLHAGLAWMAIGESLAPVIWDSLVPAMEKISNFIQNNLTDDMRMWIGLTISLTVAVTALSIAWMAFNAQLFATLVPFVAFAGMIASVVVWWRDFVSVIEQGNVALGVLKIALGLIAIIVVGVVIGVSAVGFAVVAIALLIIAHLEEIGMVLSWIGENAHAAFSYMIENVWGIFDWLMEQMWGFLENFGFIGVVIAAVIEGIVGVVVWMIDVVLTVFQLFADAFSVLGAIFQGNWEEAGQGIMQMLTDIINMFIRGINQVLIDPFTKLIQWAIDLDITGPDADAFLEGLKPARIAEFHSGGTFMNDRPGLAMLKPRERVLTETDQDALSRSMSGGMGGGGNITYNVTIVGGTFTTPAARRTEARSFMQETARQMQSRRYT